MDADFDTARRIILLGTGGTIAGTGDTKPGQTLEYVAGSISIEQLTHGIVAPAGHIFECEQIAQLDSKDMEFDVWATLASRCHARLNEPDVAAIVITHGTDTIEETAFFLHSVLKSQRKPVVLTCAMRPATAPNADGPQNLQDAILVASTTKSSGVLVVCAGEIHDPAFVRKAHPYKLNAFESGEAGPIGFIEAGEVRYVHPRTIPSTLEFEHDAVLSLIAGAWPRVEIISSHAGASGRLVDMLIEERRNACFDAVDGLVLAATGNGSIHASLEAAALRAAENGIMVVRASRCLNGTIVKTSRDQIPDAGALSPVKARIELLLELLKQRAAV